MDKQKYYITTAIAYTSGKPHIGNTYEIVLADAIAPVSYTHLRAHETGRNLVCRLLLEKKKKKNNTTIYNNHTQKNRYRHIQIR